MPDFELRKMSGGVHVPATEVNAPADTSPDDAKEPTATDEVKSANATKQRGPK